MMAVRWEAGTLLWLPGLRCALQHHPDSPWSAVSSCAGGIGGAGAWGPQNDSEVRGRSETWWAGALLSWALRSQLSSPVPLTHRLCRAQGGWQVPWGPFQAWCHTESMPVPGTTLSSERIYPQPSCWGAAAPSPLPTGRVGRLGVRSGRSGGAFIGRGERTWLYFTFLILRASAGGCFLPGSPAISEGGWQACGVGGGGMTFPALGRGRVMAVPLQARSAERALSWKGG